MFFPTLVQDYLALSAQKFPDKEALICGGERWRYREIDQASSMLACALASLGLRERDRVIILLDNSSEVIISLYGILKGGGVFIPLDRTTKAKRLGYILNDSGARILITHTNKREVVQAALDHYENPCQIIWVGDTFPIPASLAACSVPWREIFNTSCGPTAAPQQGLRIIDMDLAALIYTSGSTGEPKGVMSSHANMLSVARSIIQYLENTESEIVMNVLPLSFDYGLYQVIMTIIFGGTLVLERNFSYPVRFLEAIEKERVTGLPIVPTMAALLFRMQNLNNFDLSSLRYITNTAAALPTEYILKIRMLFPQVRLYSMYGLTECKRVSFLPPEELDRRLSSVGKAIPNSDVQVVGEDGQELPSGEIGELVVRGANVMQGYWNAPELTSRVFRQGCYPGERLLYTGDLFKKDAEGFLYFVGRKDDLIKTRGERVSPREVEAVISGLNGVEEVAVVGVPDEILGQAIWAYVVTTPEISINGNEILRHCKKHLESSKVPKNIIFVKMLPLTPNGKVDKEKLSLMETRSRE